MKVAGVDPAGYEVTARAAEPLLTDVTNTGIEPVSFAESENLSAPTNRANWPYTRHYHGYAVDVKRTPREDRTLTTGLRNRRSATKLVGLDVGVSLPTASGFDRRTLSNPAAPVMGLAPTLSCLTGK